RGIDLRHDRVGLRREAAAPHLVATGLQVPPPMTASHDDATTSRSPRRLALYAAIALVGVLAGLAGVYGIGGLKGNAAEAACQPAAAAAQRKAPLARGEGGAVAVAAAPRRRPDLALRRAEGPQRRRGGW